MDAIILVDTITGVNYLKFDNGLTPLLDKDGKVVIDTLPIEDSVTFAIEK